MPQYLAPGVYVEEIPGPRTIQGVSTSTAAFIGPARFGPTSGRPELLTSYSDFVRIYGDAVDLHLTNNAQFPNYLALGVKGFFDEGGSSLYVMRTFAYTDADHPEADHGAAVLTNAATANVSTAKASTAKVATADQRDAEQRATAPLAGTAATQVTVRARFPGRAGNLRVILTLRSGNNATTAGPNLTRVREFDCVWAVGKGPRAGAVYVVRRDPTGAWILAGGPAALALADAIAVYPLSALVEIQRPTIDSQGLPAFGAPQLVGEFGFDPRATGTGIGTVLTKIPPTRRQDLTLPIALEGLDRLSDPMPSADELPGAIARALFGVTILNTAAEPTTPLQNRQRVVTLDGGKDGGAPSVTAYDGNAVTFADYQNNAMALPFNGLLALESVDDISIVAAPGASTGWSGGDDSRSRALAINNSLINHCERMVYRVAALDTPRRFLPDEALDFRNQRSSTHAALYYPWITVSHPIDGSRVDVPPAAYLAGIWARSDSARGVIKAPANEVVRSALDFETRLNKAQQELLNPQGVNCLRFFPGSGFLAWGARTISDDPEWKYLSVRRYFNFLEKSIDEGTRYVVFEVNGPALWDAVRHTVEGFLFNQWKSGALLGAKPEQAFFVRCDASTMTADDLDNGRLIAVIGVAAAKPAEFVIFRISQSTATQTA